MIVLLSIYALGIMGFFIHIFTIDKKFRTKAKIAELFLLYQIVFSLGLTSLLSFVALSIMPKFIADYTGWPASPFEQQLANVNLAFAVLGVSAIWLRGNFWIATILGFSIWILGDGVHHIINSIDYDNMTLGNIGIPLWTDILVPLILLVSLKVHLGFQKNVS